MKTKLTKERIDRLRYEGKPTVKIIGRKEPKTWPRCVLWDTELRGFGVRVYPEGDRKSFVVSYRVGNVKKLTTLGQYGVFTPEQARQRAKSLLADVADGRDPAEERRVAKAKSLTVDALWKLYTASEKFRRKKSGPKDTYRYVARIEPAIGSKPVSAVTPEVVKALHEGMGSVP